MQVEFSALDPWFVSIVLFALVAVGLLLLFLAQRGKGFSLRSLWPLVLRTISITLLLLALAGPVLVDERRESRIVAAIDLSESMDDTTASKLLERAAGLLASAKVDRVEFAGMATHQAGLNAERWDFRSMRKEAGALNVGETDIESAFKNILGVDIGAAWQVGSDERVEGLENFVPVLLISDGHETKGDARGLLPSLRQGQYRLFPITPQEMESAGEAFSLSSLHAPLVAPAQKSVEVSVAVRNTTGAEQGGILRVQHDKNTILERRVKVKAQSEVLLSTQSDPSQDGIKQIVATFIPDDENVAKSERRVFLSGEPRERVLVMNGESVDSRFLDEALKGNAYQVESVVAKKSTTLFGELEKFSTVILNNVALRQLPDAAQAQLRRFVESGGGLVVSGGAQSFGLGGYQNSALDDLLPVRSIPPRAEEKRLNVAVQLVIDKSQSMSKEQRLEFAKEAARGVVQSLKDEDYIGVIGFDLTPFEVLKTTIVGGNREYAIERIGRMYPKDQTWLLPALREARRRLEATPAGRKHMIIVTDGQLRDAGPVYLEDVRQARLLGITVSTVLIGGEFDFGFLRSLSEAGGGRFYAVNDPSQLPRIFIQDVTVRSGEKTLRENEKFPVRFGSGDVRSTTIRSFPFLKGFVETRIKPEANYELAVASGVDLQPLLASWMRGKGKVIAYTSDNNGRWSSEWVGWRQYRQFWSNVVDATRSDAADESKNIRFDLRHFVSGNSLEMEVAVFDDIGALPLQAEVVLPSGDKAEVKFQRVSKGRYSASIPRATAGTFRVALAAESSKFRFTPVAFDVSGESFGEQKGLGFNIPFLEELSRATGGVTNPKVEQLLNAVQRYKVRSDLRHYFLLAALLVLLLEVLHRELGLRVWRRGMRARA